MNVQTDRPIADRYFVEGNEVQQGVVELWDATDRQLERPVTIQMLTEEASQDPDLCNTFLQHQQIACTIHNSAVQAVYDAGVWEGRPFSVMQKRDGVPASTLYRPGYLPDTPFALSATRQVAIGLQSCRDAGLTGWALSPEDVQIDPEGNAHFAIIEGSPSESNMESSASDLTALKQLLRLMLVGDANTSMAELRAGQVPNAVVNLLERLDAEQGDGIAGAGQVATEIAAIESAAIQPTQAYEPDSAIVAPVGIPSTIEDGNPVASAEPAASPKSPDQSEAPTLVAPVLTLNQPYDPPASGMPQTSPFKTARVPGPPDNVTLPFEEYAPQSYVPPVERARVRRPTRRFLPWLLPLAGLSLLLILAFVMIKVLGSASRVEGQSANSATSTPIQSAALVPDVRGKSLDDARSIAAAAGLNLVEADSAYDATYPAGKVGSQQPAPGQQVQAGSYITVSVSLGPVPVVNQPPADKPPPNPPPKKGKDEDKGKHK